MQMKQKPDFDSTNALDKFGRNLVDLVKDGKIDPVIGRDDEIRRIIRILLRKTKNNPILIGEPGVGKTAIVEGLAWRIYKNDVPDTLKNKKIYELEISSLVAGAMYQGEFEERLKTVLKQVKDSDGNIILFIDEIHTVVGAGRSGGSLDASNMLKPMLARGELHCIGATTYNEYQKYIESDAALERRFQKVTIDQPTVEDTISILRGLKDRFETYHGVTITDNAIVTASTLSNRYITDRFLPDKAIDLIDEACATIRSEIDSKPTELDELDRKILQLKIEKSSLKKETDTTSKKRLKDIKEEIDRLEKEQQVLDKRWKAEKAEIAKQKEVKTVLEQKRRELDDALNTFNYEKAAILQNSEIPKLEEKLNSLTNDDENKMLSERVTSDNVCEIISKWTNIPLNKILQGEREKLLHLDDELKERVIGQEEAVQKVTNAIIRARAGIKDPSKPIGSFMFLGPTGVGKTEIAKSLAYSLFDSESQIIRIDMSEYMERYSVSRLIGAPPGYVGYDEGGQLTEAVRRKPYSIVLFDEIEKAHHDVFNVLLQILDDGRITDGKGRTVDFKNTIIIMTSNIGSEHILNERPAEVMNEVREHFRPEFLNRLDDIIIFKALTKDVCLKIVNKFIRDINLRLKDNDITIEATPKAKDYIVDNSYEPNYGARPIKRFIQSFIETNLARKIISDEIKYGDNVLIDCINNELVLTKKQ